MSPPSLSTLLRAADPDGDEAAFAALLRRHAALVRGVCRRIAAVTASNSSRFHASGEDRSVRVWDVAAGKEVQKLHGPPNGS